MQRAIRPVHVGCGGNMKKTLHFMKHYSTTDAGMYLVTTWCGRVSDYDLKLRVTKAAKNVTCEECKEASAMKLLSEVG